jgi:hypothetical protein
MIKKKDKVYFTGRMDVNMKEAGKTENNMGEVITHLQVEN